MGETCSAFLGSATPSTEVEAKLEFRAGAPGIPQKNPIPQQRSESGESCEAAASGSPGRQPGVVWVLRQPSRECGE